VRALVTGAGGQDGSLLVRLLVSHDIQVLGVDRSDAADGRHEGAEMRAIDVTDEGAITRLMADFKPDQVYHLAACHHSSEAAGHVALERQMIETNFRSAEFLIEYIAERLPNTRILLAGSSQMYRALDGECLVVSESTPMNPSTFYGRTKAWARELLAYYRNERGIFGTTAILFNHESPRRSPQFVTRKITMAAARAKRGRPEQLHLRDISAKTDWSSASDVVEGMRLMLGASEPDDYVLASGKARRVQDVLDAAFGFVGLDWRALTTFDPPSAGPQSELVGNSLRIRQSLGWQAAVTFEAMIEEMVASDILLLDSQKEKNAR
jgi:GDPmannose 4,6-dehydratase